MKLSGVRVWKPRLFFGGAACAAAAIAAARVLPRESPWSLLLSPVILGWVIIQAVSVLPRPVTLEFRGRELWMSWRGTLNIDPGTARLGKWVEWYVDTAVGVYVELRGPSGAVRIGARNRSASGLSLALPARRTVDVAVPPEMFDTLLRELAVQTTPPQEPVVELVPNSQSASGMMAVMVPWLVTMAVLGIVGVTLGPTLADTAYGPVLLMPVCIAIALVGMGLTLKRFLTVKKAELALHIGQECIVERPGKGVVTRAAWNLVRAEPRVHVEFSRVGTARFPALSLNVGGSNALTIGARAPQYLWQTALDASSTLRQPEFLVSPADWESLVGKLQRQGCLAA